MSDDVKTMVPSENCIKVLHYFESCKLTAYPDPGSRNGLPWTIGWGATGEGITEGTVWTQEQADKRFALDLQVKAADPVLRVVNVPLTQGQFDALVSWAYNLGAGSLKSSTLLKKLHAGNMEGAAAELLKWHFNDGKPLLGLMRRRAAEKALFEGKSAKEAIQIGKAVTNSDKLKARLTA